MTIRQTRHSRAQRIIPTLLVAGALLPTVLVAGAFLAAGLIALPSVSHADNDDLPPGVVAIVGGRKLTFEGFCKSAAQQSEADLKRQRAGPRSVLEQLIEELMVRQECDRLGLKVTKADVDKQWRDWDKRLRVTSNGERTLLETLKQEGTTRREFVDQMWHILRKERVARHPKYLGKLLPRNESARLQQIGIVIATVRKNTDVKYGVLTLDHIQQKEQPATLPDGQIATVNGVPILQQDYGRALVMRLSEDKVREYLDRECKTALMSLEGVHITDAELAREIEHLRELWPLQRELQREEIWRTVSFKDRFEADFKSSIADVKKSRYNRGLLGLVRRKRAEVTEKDILKKYEKERNGRFGAHILVTDVQISFAQKDGLLAGGRSHREALRMGRNLVSRHGGGVSFDRLAADVNKKQDRSFQAKRIRLYKTSNTSTDSKGRSVSFNRDMMLYDQAARMRDGDVTSPFATLAEVHVMHRVGMRPARTLEDVRPHIREVVAREKARAWIQEKVNSDYVKLRWPLTERK